MPSNNGNFSTVTISSWLGLFCLVVFVRCANSEPPLPATTVPAQERQQATLVPTYTPQVTRAGLNEPDLMPTAISPEASETDTPIPFDETVVELRYKVPALALDRRLQGNVANELILVDESTGTAVQRNNQPHIIIELEQALPKLNLIPVPPDCPNCVQLSYSIPLQEESGEGWLQDTRLLASLENFMSIALGSHLPPDTLVGLRRSASPYAPAHTVVLTEDGRVWRWLATDATIADSSDVDIVAPNLNLLHAQLIGFELQESYEIPCTGQLPTEQLFLRREGELEKIEIFCPDYALPTLLLPIYLQLDELVAPKLLEAASIPYPPSGFPLTAVVDYKREDGSRLTIKNDGYAEAMSPTKNITTTLTASQLLSLTLPLLESGELSRDLTEIADSFVVDSTNETKDDQPSSLVIRGKAGVFGIFLPDAPDRPRFLQDLDRLLDELLQR